MFKQFFLSERNIMMAIFINAIIICLIYFPQIEHGNPTVFTILEQLDHFFIVLFLVEAIVKLKVLGTRKYFSNNWNIFDFVIVLISLPGLMTFIPFFAAHNFSFIKVLRLFRLVRLLRVFSFIPNIENIIAGLGRAIKSSVFVIIVLIFLNFLFALFTCHFYGDILPEYFGDPLISSYYIFQMFTVEGWNEIPNAISDAADQAGMEYASMFSGIARFYFILIVLTGGIFGMSLANAIFVDEMTMDNNKLLENKIDLLIEKINKLEEQIDKK